MSSIPLQPAGPRSPWALLALLALAAAGARWLTRAPLIYSWDSVHYILAQERYDLLAHQPHPPGSFYYVLLARAARGLTGDPHAALLLLGALFGGLLVVVLFLLGREWGGVRAGWIAAALAATAPLFWFYGSVALNYGPAATLSALAALGCLRLALGRSPLLSGLLAGGALGLLGGFRPTDVAFMAPAYLWALATYWRGARGASAGERARVVAASILAAAVLTLGWLVPNIVSAGGVRVYIRSIRALEHLLIGSSAFSAGWGALRSTVTMHRRTLESALGLAWLPVIAGLVLRWRSPAPEERSVVRDPRFAFTALVVLPAFLFYLLGHFASPGYALVYAGVLAAAGAAACIRLLERIRREAVWPAVAAALLIGNAAIFLWGWPGEVRHTQRGLSAAELRDHGRYYRELRAFLEARYAPGEVRLLCSWTPTDGLRTVQALLPEYATDVAQAVGIRPHLPPEIGNLPWLRLLTPEEIEAEGRPVYAIMRTRDDSPYQHAHFAPERWEAVPIGPGHRLYRLRSAAAPGSSPRR